MRSIRKVCGLSPSRQRFFVCFGGEGRPSCCKKAIFKPWFLSVSGVNLWNASGLFRQDSENDNRVLVAALRLAGFRLMEAGLEAKPNAEALLHVLQIASKAGSTLSEVGNNASAASVLASAAQYEEALRNLDDPDGVHQAAKARVTTVYFSSRMEAAWREKNDGLATFMADKVIENERQLALLPARDRELLAAKLLDIGKSILRACHQGGKAPADGTRALDAVRWMQKAFQVIDPLDSSASPGFGELKRSVLRSLARGYFLASSQDPEYLTRAEAALEEVIATTDASVEHASSAHQQLRWMKLAIVKRRKAGDTVLLQAIQAIIDNMPFSENDLTDVLQELRTLTHHHDLVTAATKYCLRRAIGCSADTSSIEKLLISLLFHCSKGDNHAKALKDLEESFQGMRRIILVIRPFILFPCAEVCEASIDVSKTAACACLTLIWQYGDRHYHASRWAEAADWFMCGTHAMFSCLGSSSSSKCFRKAALCYLQQKEYAQAASTIRRCPRDGATNHYVAFLIAVHQGLEDEAIRAVREMVVAPDFDRRMLLLACRLSHDSDMKGLLLSVLKALLDTLNHRANVKTVTEAMTLVRCIIRLALKLLGEPGANIRTLVQTLLDYFGNAKTLVENVPCEDAALVIRDLSWLWRTAYNCAIDGCTNWDNETGQVSTAFDLARQLLELYVSRSVTEVEPNVYLYIANASFAATSGRVILARERLAQDDNTRPEALRCVSADVKSCKARISDLLVKVSSDDQPQLHSFLHVLRVFDVEMDSQLRDWDSVLGTIDEATRMDKQALVTFEAFGDILWEDKNCPVNGMMVTTSTEQEYTNRPTFKFCMRPWRHAILHACLAHNQLPLDKFSRWLRSICTILLSQGTAPDRSKAIQYMAQASAVLEEHGNLMEEGIPLYPNDERLWLLSTAYNTGVECLQFVASLFRLCVPPRSHVSSASVNDEAKRWFECATVFCRFVPDGKQRAERVGISNTIHYAHRFAADCQISGTYTGLLARYARR
ncbi:hypothetical protein F5I97DRAFT_1969338 [Phlebopus sp. FC_14]|nr:hypothetical protein F5I97DRAFT_1969338 [Phlebopus sp. FC_14]